MRFKIFAFALTLLFAVPAKAARDPELAVDAKAAVLMEAVSGKTIYDQNGGDRLAPASITKIMTILLIYDALESGKIGYDDVVTVSEHAASMGGSQIFLEPGEKQKVRDMLKSVCIASANDASVAMAEFIAGSELSFVGMMNEKANELGMFNTNFENACGLDSDNHYSSAYDVALMSRELITKHPEVAEFATTWQDAIIHETARGSQEFGLTNTNKLVKTYSGITGLKTGSTSKALYCLSGTAERDGLNLVAVVLGAPEANTRFSETARMLDFGFANYSIVNGDEIGTVKGKIKVFKGDEDYVDVEVKDKVAALADKGSKTELESSVELLEGVSAPFAAGTKAGEITYFYNGQEVGKSDLVTAKAIEKAGFTRMIKKIFQKWSE
jgi:D-alanyl-D-alanine carboxypeptidase (penicillin-binding protein 5/6)